MESPKVCRGCFCEWEEEWEECPHCGWSPGKTYETLRQWTTGAVLEQRYLIGALYLQCSELAVWRIYDNLLGISCFAMRNLREDAEDAEVLLQTARLMQGVEEQRKTVSTEGMVRILSMKAVEKNIVLLFSMREKYFDPKEFEKDYLASVYNVFLGNFSDTLEQNESKGAERKEALPPDTILDGRYRVLDCIGIGGFGITYRCEELYLHREAAVKEYFPGEWAQREETYVEVKQSGYVEPYRFGMNSFLKECRITAKFIHTPHIVTAYDAFYDNDTIYLAMEYVDGVSIGREFRRREYRPYTPMEVSGIICPVLEALEEIHEKSIVHSDISPGNIMRTRSGKIMLIDLGAAKYSLDSQPSLGVAFLKLDYAAPEQYRTAKAGTPKDEGPWTDVYAVGATMYYLLTGQKPTDVIRRLEGKDTKLEFPLRYRLQLSGKWRRLIGHAMELDRNERIGSARELEEEIKRL